MENITYVTSNYGKYVSVKEQFEKSKLNIEFFKIDFNEPNINDIRIVSKAKAMEAYEILKKPCFVIDSSFHINGYPNNPGYPGVFVKRSGISSNIDDLLIKMKNVKNRNCHFVDCLTFYDGNNFYNFFGISEGTIAEKPCGEPLRSAKSNLWYVFIPRNCHKTLAEMTKEERENRQDDNLSATSLFIEWYKTKYLDRPKTYKKNKY